MSFTTPALQVQRLSMQAVLPGTSSLQASDYTLHSAYDLVVPAHGKALVRTDCAISAPPGLRLNVFALPGLAWVHHVSVSAASTDRRGVAVVLFNHSESPLDIAAGAAIALLVLERVGALVVQEVQQLPTEVTDDEAASPAAVECTSRKSATHQVPVCPVGTKKCRRGRRSAAGLEKRRRPRGD